MNTTSSAMVLIFLGIAGAVFFWLTDPSLGVATHLMDNGLNRIDASNQAWLGTYIGLGGSVIAVLVGLWNIWRRPA